MPRVRTSSAAERDITEILLYIGREDRSPDGALKLYEALKAASKNYAANPHLGTAREDLGVGLRLFSFGTSSNPRGWVVIYRPIEDGIHLLRVFRSAQDYERLF